MNTKSWTLLVITYYILLEYHETNAAVTLLLESPGPLKNSSALESKVREATQKEEDRVTKKMLLTKDKAVRDAWRTEKGDLVELQYLNAYSLRNISPLQERSTILMTRNDEKPSDNSLPEARSQNGLANQITPDALYGPVTSHRMKRTFWPFTSLFGYDYDYPPPPPPFGPFGPTMMPPYGGGFGFGYPGPFAPQPPLLGLGFNIGF